LIAIELCSLNQGGEDGQRDSADLRPPLRASEGDQLLEQTILETLSRKPKGHDFVIDRRAVRGVADRHMSVTGG
jgi:GTP 3',8-cyclase